nr:MAG TPA: hypothetical protein [Caudoviricetes sp.]
MGFESPLSHQAEKALEINSRAFLLLYQLYFHVLQTYSTRKYYHSF